MRDFPERDWLGQAVLADALGEFRERGLVESLTVIVAWFYFCYGDLGDLP